MFDDTEVLPDGRVDDTEVLPDKETFEDRLKTMLKTKRSDNLSYMDRGQYLRFIEETKAARQARPKTAKHFRRFRRFGVAVIDGEEKLIAPLKNGQMNMIFYAPNEELYDILLKVHLEVGHGKRDKLH